MATRTYQLVVEVEADEALQVCLDDLELHCLHALRGRTVLDGTSIELKFNTVVFETSYPTPNPEEL